MHPAQLAIDQLLADCKLRNEKRSGPGGQHRNKVETAVVVTHAPSGIRGEASERRSQAANRTTAIFRLRLNLACQIRTPVRDAVQQSSPLWHNRTENGKLAIAADHDDFPAILAECMDVLSSQNFDLSGTAKQLGVTSSQIIKLLKKHPPAFLAVNEARRGLGLRVLK